MLDILEGADEMTDGWMSLWLIQEHSHLAHILPTLTGRQSLVLFYPQEERAEVQDLG